VANDEARWIETEPDVWERRFPHVLCRLREIAGGWAVLLQEAGRALEIPVAADLMTAKVVAVRLANDLAERADSVERAWRYGTLLSLLRVHVQKQLEGARECEEVARANGGDRDVVEAVASREELEAVQKILEDYA
jgi:hypothetical protein